MRHALAGLSLWLLVAGLVHAAPHPPGYAIATAHPLATQAGVEILQAGGNAFDAAVAITAALAVVEPSGSGLGGGGFYLLHEAESGRKIFVDAREKAPLAATPDMYLDKNGEVDADKLRAHPLAAGIPGIPAAMEHLSRNYGRLKFEQVLQPALAHARNGFPVDAKLASYIAFRAADLKQYPASAQIYLPLGKPVAQGATLQQPDLAKTLQRMAVFGASGFYTGAVADALVSAVRASGGIWSAKDLSQYQVKERIPVILDYRGWQIVTAPPPSSGGLVLGEMLNILSGYNWPALTPIDQVHLSVEAMRRAYFDRARYMGDTDFVEVPSRMLLGEDYAKTLRAGINLQRATVSSSLGAKPAESGNGRNTTHFSVIDDAGNRVAATLSINYMLGSAFVAAGTGVVLNNEMDDFVAKPGVANGYGLVGSEANAIAPGKRMLSSMSPTFVEGPDRIAIIGTPGGSRIISMVYHAMQAVIAGNNAKQIVSLPRYHHQYVPDEIQFETGALSDWRVQALQKRGHTLKDIGGSYGNMQAVIWDLKKQRLDAASDPRGVGRAVVGTREAVKPVLPTSRAPALP